jgi:hypothetical protein
MYLDRTIKLKSVLSSSNLPKQKCGIIETLFQSKVKGFIMTDNNLTSSPNISFKDFLFQNRRNRAIILIAAASIIIQFAIFKYYYPFANYLYGDSFSYIEAAYKNLSINTYLVGYSKFLRLFSVFSKSDTALALFQYLFVQGSSMLILFTLFYFYKTGKVIQILLLTFFVFNPLLLHMGNLVSSDCFFLALSMIWLSTLIWIINRPTNWILFCHIMILFISFTVRYNALIYPIFSATVILLSKIPFKTKAVFLFLGITSCSSFIGFTTYEYKKLTNYWQYSPFSGWQWANNAMYAYRYVDSVDRKPVPKKFQALDNVIKTYFDTTRDTNKHPTEAIMASTFYMWSPGMPLLKYQEKVFKNDTSSSELRKWAIMGPFYKEYGIYIIKQYPTYYLKYFIWPNANKFYAPPIEFLELYNYGKKTVLNIAANWFSYRNNLVSFRGNSGRFRILSYYPIYSGMINLVMFFLLIGFIFMKGWRFDKSFSYLVMLGGTLWLLNALFTIIASSAALRFQAFPIFVTTILTAITMGRMIDFLQATQSDKNLTAVRKNSQALIKQQLS